MVTANNMRDDWWKQAVVYQIYPRSFKDVNGDGLGDIAGVTEKMDYLKNLGIDAIWLSPFYPSDLADGGYDVIDYRNVDPRLGTMADFDAMAAAAHEAGIKVIVDIVPNHTSNKHKMFIEALAAGRGSAARDRYIFREGRGEHGELPPNDWQSLFGGPAWQQVDDGQWYLHMFAKEQPDLNWKNPDVHDIYREWRQVFNEYNPPRFAVGEAWVKAESQHLYASTDELGQVFNFEFAEANWFADEFRTAIADGLRAAEETHGSTTTWVMNNHDVPRSPSRFGLPQVKDAPYHQLAHDWLLRDGETYRENRELGTRRARAAALMELGLPGSAYVYQGEELGLFEVANIPWDRLEDPTPFNTRRNFTDKGRDGCRVPMPWKAADCGEPASWSPDFITGGTFGFGPEQGDSADAHLPQPAWFKDFAADVEADDNGSMLHLYRKLLQLRQTVLTATGDTSADLLDMGDTVVAYSRPATEGRRFLSVTNFGDEPIALPDDAVAIANSVPLTDDGKLDSDASVWLLLG